jgi:uncharacterized protein DUF4168
MRPRLLPLLAATAVMLAWAPATTAQSGKPDTASPGATAPSSNITDQKLDAAAAALQRVVSLQQQYRAKLAQTPDASDQQRLVAEANGELAKAVTDQGLSVEEYSSIMQVAQNDPEVRGKLLQRIDPAAKEPAAK